MKKLSVVLVILFSVFILSTGCKNCGSDSGDVIKLSYSIFFPPSHEQCKAAEEWAREIEKKTDGRIKIDIFPAGTLTSANECYNGVVKGISDIGMSCFAYTRGRFPVMEAADLPLGYNTGKAATYAVNDFFSKMNPDELKDVKVLYLHAHGPGLLHTKKAVSKQSDLKGMKIRSTGLCTKVVEALGGTAVAMPQGDTYEALQKGVVDGTFTPIETLKGWKQGEVIKYTTDCRGIGYTTAMFVVMNPDKWNSLPEDIKDIFTEAGRQWIDFHARVWDEVDAEGRKFTLGLKNQIITLPPDEAARWTAAVKPVIDEYIKTSNAAGLPGEKIINELKSIIKEYNSKFPL